MIFQFSTQLPFPAFLSLREMQRAPSVGRFLKAGPHSFSDFPTISYSNVIQLSLFQFPDDPRLVDLRVSDLRQLSQRFDERELLKSYPKRLVRTYESDLMYPWSQGKAPWSVEQGGDGHVPDNAREKVSWDNKKESGCSQLFFSHNLARNKIFGDRGIFSPMKGGYIFKDLHGKKIVGEMLEKTNS